MLFKVFQRYKTTKIMMKESLKKIFLKSVSAVQPEQLIKNEIKVIDIDNVASERHLVIKGQSFVLPRKCYLVGFGKAVLGMATEMEKVLGDKLQRAVVSVPVGIFERFETGPSRIEFIEGANNNLPDSDAMEAAARIKDLVQDLKENDLLIVLVSGGGSALLPLPIPTISLEEKQTLIRELARRGASINELNNVRKKISLLKGGGLAQLAYPCKVISLILSDIVGDPLDLIASGPTVMDTDRLSTAKDILEKYKLYDEIPESLKKVFRDNSANKKRLENFDHVNNFILGNNRIAAEAALIEAQHQGFQSCIVSTQVEGEVNEIADAYSSFANFVLETMTGNGEKDNLCKFLLEELSEKLKINHKTIEDILEMDYTKDLCFIFAGEPTVIVKGKGKGGRNQQLALAFAAKIRQLNADNGKVAFLSCGTDGIDGPTDAAGAISPMGEFDIGVLLAYLENNDAYNFFEKLHDGEYLIKIGHTGTNVMDIHVMLIRR